jgi:hypothetical protein
VSNAAKNREREKREKREKRKNAKTKTEGVLLLDGISRPARLCHRADLAQDNIDPITTA